MDDRRGRPKGSKTLNKINLSSLGRVKVNPGAKTQNIEKDHLGKWGCTCCGKVYISQAENFMTSSSPLYAGNNGRLSICKVCLKKYYDQLVEFFSGNQEKAIERCCQLFDWFYSEEAVAAAKKTSSTKALIGSYVSKINLNYIQSKGSTYDDTLIHRDTSVIETQEDIEKAITKSADAGVGGGNQIDEETIRFFGLGHTPREYDWLSNQYNDWVSKYECKTKAQEELFKNISLNQLVGQRALQNGEMGLFNATMKTFQDLLGSAKLKPNQADDNFMGGASTFGLQIRKWENEKPIPEYPDINLIVRCIQTYFLGHLAKMFKLNNLDPELMEQYRKEIEKYTATPRKFNEEDSTDADLLKLFERSRDSAKSGGGGDYDANG